MKMANVALLIHKKAAERRWKYGLNVFEAYAGEILSHAGISFIQLDDAQQLSDQGFDVLITALEDEDMETTQSIWQFAEQGGAVISYGGLSGLAGQLGCVKHSVALEAYANLPFGQDFEALRCIQAKPWEVKSADAPVAERVGSLSVRSARGERTYDALQRFTVGRGSIDRWAVDIPTTVVGFQQGTIPVLHDGIPPVDGTAQIDEGILKADDVIEMDWELDRLKTETGNDYFAIPYADYWREACIGHLLRTVTAKGLTLPFIGYWPDGVDLVALISHDSDGNQDEYAESTLEVLKECQVHSVWCMLEPGYSPHIYQRIKEEGHELAFHYNALETQNGKWGEEEFVRQLAWLKEAAGITDVTSNKNHYTRYEGWGELFQWCEKYGIAVDQTRGASKGGNVGFLFGTCHPYFPISWSDERNRLYDVLEMGFLTQDMGIGAPWADSSIIVPFLQQARRVEGVAHFLFHQAHIHSKSAVVEAFHKVIDKAREMGFTFWTSKQINDWERARRKLRIDGVDGNGNVKVKSEAELHDVVVWIPIADKATEVGEIEQKFGMPCVKQVVSLL